MSYMATLSRAVPPRLVFIGLAVALLWRVDGVLDVRLEWFIVAPLLLLFSLASVFTRNRASTVALAAVLASVAVTVLAYYYDLLFARKLLQLVVSALINMIVLLMAFDVDFGVTPLSRCRVIVWLWIGSLLADEWIHPVVNASGHWHFACMLLVLVNWPVIGLAPFPKLLRAVWHSEDLELHDIDAEQYDDEVYDDDDDEEIDELDELDDEMASFRAALQKAGSNDDDNNAPDTTIQEDVNDLDAKAREFYQHLQMAKAELIERESLRYQQLADNSGRANVGDEYELSFESWSNLSSQLQSTTTPDASDSEDDAASSSLLDRCVLCGNKPERVKKCQACMLASYCSSDCQVIIILICSPSPFSLKQKKFSV
jgi:hypothetical protein